MIGTGERSAIFGQENQRAAMPGCRNGVHRLTAPMAMTTPRKANASEPSRPVLQRALRLEDQPAGAEQGIAEDERDAGQERERA